MSQPSIHFETPPLHTGKPWDPPTLPQLSGLWEDPVGADPVPDETACLAVWQRYGMFEHIGRHSRQVANMAEALAARAAEIGAADRPDQLRAISRAAGLLHDIAKSYTVQHGGSHAQIGSSWVVAATGNHRIAQAVYHHVEWPWPLPESLIHPVFFVIYADKRARHDEIVTLDERYEDLLVRYGKSERSRAAIYRGWEHAKTIERVLSTQLEFSLHESTTADGRLVARA